MKYLILAALALCSMSYAQERTAAGGTETQMTWSALSGQIHAVSTKTDAVNTRVDQIVVCAKKGMVYAPGTAGTDAQGCLEASQAGNTTNNLTNLTNTLNALTNNYNNMVTCNKAGQTYDGTKCVSASSGNRWIDPRITGGAQYANVPGGYNSGTLSGVEKKAIAANPWGVPACSAVSGFGVGYKCAKEGDGCYIMTSSYSSTQGNCSSCNGPSRTSYSATLNKYTCN